MEGRKVEGSKSGRVGESGRVTRKKVEGERKKWRGGETSGGGEKKSGGGGEKKVE